MREIKPIFFWNLVSLSKGDRLILHADGNISSDWQAMKKYMMHKWRQHSQMHEFNKEIIWLQRKKGSCKVNENTGSGLAHTRLSLVLSPLAQSCLTLCDPMHYSLPGSSVHGILQARILEWVAMPYCRGTSQPRNQTRVSCIAGRFFTSWATREAHSSLYNLLV